MDAMLLAAVVLVLVALVGVFYVFWRHRREGRLPEEPKYEVFFALGLVWVLMGFLSGNNGLYTLGLIFFIIGLSGKLTEKIDKR